MAGIEQKLLQHLQAVCNGQTLQGLNPPNSESDIKYEFGRRVGYKQGMDAAIKQVLQFFTEESRDKDL